MSLQYFIRRVDRGVVGRGGVASVGCGVNFGVLVVVLAVCALSGVFSIQAGAQAPSAPTGVSLLPAHDTGKSNSDGITNRASGQTFTFIVEGSFNVGDTIRLIIGDDNDNTDDSPYVKVVGVGETSSINIDVVENFIGFENLDTWYASAQRQVSGGNRSAFSSRFSFGVERTPPSLTVTQSGNGAISTNRTFTIEASDPTGLGNYDGSGLDKVEKYDNVNSCDASTTGTPTTLTLTNGSVDVTVQANEMDCFKATDIAGNVRFAGTPAVPQAATPVIDIRTSSASGAKTFVAEVENIDGLTDFAAAADVDKANCDSSATFVSSPPKSVFGLVNLPAGTHYCYRATNATGTTYASTEDAIVVGNTATDIANGTYFGGGVVRNSSSQTPYANNGVRIVGTDSIRIGVAMVPDNPVRLFVRKKGAAWPDVSASVGGTASSDGWTNLSYTPTAGEGEYEFAFQVRLDDGSTYAPAHNTLTPVRSFIFDQTNPVITITKVSGGDDTTERVFSAAATDANGIPSNEGYTLAGTPFVYFANISSASDCVRGQLGAALNTTTPYTAGTNVTVPANQHLCFYVVDYTAVASHRTLAHTTTAVASVAGPEVHIAQNSGAGADTDRLYSIVVPSSTTTTVADSVTTCSASGTTSATFVSYTPTTNRNSPVYPHLVEANTQDCFKVVDSTNAASVTYIGTANAPRFTLADANDTGIKGDLITNPNASSGQAFTFLVSNVSYSSGDIFRVGSQFLGITSITKTLTTADESGFSAVYQNTGSSTYNITAGNRAAESLRAGVGTFSNRNLSLPLFLDAKLPVITIANGTTPGTFTATATDDTGLDKYEVANGVVQSNCAASTIGATSFSPYTSGAVHTATPSSRSCFKVTDAAGNVAYKSTAVAPASDTTAPTVNSGATVVSNNSTNTAFAKVNDTITVTFTVSEALASTPSVTIAGDTATVTNPSGNTYSAVITVDSNTEEGVAKYTIGTLTDAAGNTTNPAEVTTTVTVDTTRVSILSVNLSSNNASARLAKLGDIVTAEISLGETILQAPTVAIAGQDATVVGSGTSYTATLTVTATTPEGNISYDIGEMVDAAGNAYNPGPITKTTANTRVLVDRTAPVITVADGTASNTFTATATDTNGSGVATYGVADSVSASNCTATNIGGTSFSAYTSGGDHPVSSGTASCFRVFDNAGNVAYASTGTTVVVPPAPTDIDLITSHDTGSSSNDGITNRAANQIFTFNVDGSFTQGGTVGLQITDPDNSSVSGIFSKTVGSGETSSINVNVAANTFTDEGEYTITATQTANSQTSAVSSEYTLTIDRTNPVFGTSPSWKSTASQFSDGFYTIDYIEHVVPPLIGDIFNPAVATDETSTVTLVYGVAFSSNDRISPTATCTNSAYTYNINTVAYEDVDSWGRSRVCARATDVAGNISHSTATGPLTVILRPPQPTGITLHTNSDSGSVDGITNRAANQPFTFTVTGTFFVGKHVRLTVEDTDGIERVHSKTIGATETSSIDITIPASANRFGQEREYTIDAWQDIDGVLSYDFSLGGSPYTFTIDRTAPVITVADGTASNTFTASATDTNGSGVATYGVADSVTESNCTVANIGGTSFASYTSGDDHPVSSGTASCFRVTDVAGNVAYASTGTVAVVPPAPTGVTLEAASDFGTKGDNITRAPDADSVGFVVTGNFTVGGTVALQLKTPTNTAVSGTFSKVVTGGETSSITVSVGQGFTVDGAYTVTATQTVNSQTSTLSPVYTVTIDNTNPVFRSSPSWKSTASQFSGGNYTIDYDEHTASPTIGDLFNFATATDTNTPTLRYAVATSATDPTATCSNTSTYSYTIETLTYAAIDSEGKTRVCARAVDVAGNTAYSTATAVLTVDLTPPVVDNTAPSISSATLTSHNTNTKVATVGDTLTLAFVTDEALAGTPTVNIADTAAVVSGSGTSFSALLIVTSSTQEGAVTYDIGTLTDAAGNTRNPSPVTTAGSTLVTVDTTDPTLTVADATNTAITSDRTFTITASDTNTVTVGYLNDVDSCTAQTSGDYTSLALTSGTTTRVVEANEQDCFKATDVAGNTTYRSTPAVPGQPPVVDTTAPSISSATLTSNNTNTRVATVGDILTLAFVTDEALASTPTVNIADTAAVVSGSGTTFSAILIVASTTQEGAVTYDIGELTDAASNTRNPAAVTTAGSTLVTVDTTDPTLTVADANNGAISTDRTFTITASDTNTVTVDYLNDVDSCTAQTSGDYTSLTLTSGTTTRVVEANEQDCFRATDVAGNTTYTGTPAVSDPIDPPVTPPTNPPVSPPSSTDTTAPTFDISYAGSPNVVNNIAYYNTTTLTTGGVTVSNITEENLATATLTLARTDTTGIPNLTPASAIHSVTGAVSFANATSVPNGIYTATVTLTDDAGNATTKTLNLVVDNTTPTITGITIPDPSARSSVRATVTVRHNQTIQETLTATLAGQNCSRLNSITLTGSGTTSTQIQLRGRTGTFTCTITLTDQAGNTSTSFTIPSFTIERSSSGGGGGGVRSGGYVGVPTFRATNPSIILVPTSTQPTQPAYQPVQPAARAPLSPELQARIAILKSALNRILERIQYLIAQKTNG